MIFLKKKIQTNIFRLCAYGAHFTLYTKKKGIYVWVDVKNNKFTFFLVFLWKIKVKKWFSKSISKSKLGRYLISQIYIPVFLVIEFFYLNLIMSSITNKPYTIIKAPNRCN